MNLTLNLAVINQSLNQGYYEALIMHHGWCCSGCN